MKIRKKLIKHNFKSRAGTKIKYIVIHDTANASLGATADAHQRYFDDPARNGVSAHYFVDENEVLQIVEDTNSAGHVGDGKGKNGITNANSIGIEICINDGNYDKEIDRTLELVRHLMDKHNVPIENVVRHFDASGKNCPGTMRANNWAAWNLFKARLAEKPTSIVSFRYKGKVVTVPGVVEYDAKGNATNYVALRAFGEALNHKVGYDATAKLPTIDE